MFKTKLCVEFLPPRKWEERKEDDGEEALEAMQHEWDLRASFDLPTVSFKFGLQLKTKRVHGRRIRAR